MDTGDRDRFRKLLRMMVLNFRVQSGEDFLLLYWHALQDVPIAALERATDVVLAERKYMPTIAELRELAGYGKRAPTPAYLLPAAEPSTLCARHRGWPTTDSDPDPNCHDCRRSAVISVGASYQGRTP